MWTTDSAGTASLGRSALGSWSAGDVLKCALPHLGPSDRLLLRGLALVASRHVVSIQGLQHIAPARDPFILVANHGTMRESALVPSLLFLSRGGKRIHFLADWNYRIWPGIGLMYRRAEVVTVLRKPGRPRALNFLKAFYAHDHPPRVQARMHLAAGRSIGIFPEGQINPDPERMQRGRHGAARLSLELGVPVVPMGIRFPNVARGEPIPGNAPMALHIGAPVLPMKSAGPQASLPDVRAWHAAIMGEVARLSGKLWTEEASRGR